jgi:TPR repeat protein
VVYGPAPRSHADEVRARIAAEHEAARARREANPERQLESARYGSCCPICLEEWDPNCVRVFQLCCCRVLCFHCRGKVRDGPCPLCRTPRAESISEELARLRRHVENDIPEAVSQLGESYETGNFTRNGLVKSYKKAAKIYKRAVELGSVEAMVRLGRLIFPGREAGGVKVDLKKALQLFRMAADRGDTDGQFILGVFLVQQNKAEGLFYLSLAADQGHIQSYKVLGQLYETGDELVERDLDEARHWYECAVAKGTALENMASAIASGKYGNLDGMMKPLARQSLSDAREALDRLGANDA